MNTIKIFKNTFGTVFFTILTIVCFNCNLAIAHDTSESDITKRCSVVKVLLDLGTAEKFPETQLKVALTSKEIYAAVGGKDNLPDKGINTHTIALSAILLVDGIRISISGNIVGINSMGKTIIAQPNPLVIDEVPYESSDVEVINCTIYY